MGDYGSALTNACLKNYNLQTGLLCMDNLGFDASPIELNSAGKHRQLVSWIWILTCLPEKKLTVGFVLASLLAEIFCVLLNSTMPAQSTGLQTTHQFACKWIFRCLSVADEFNT